MDDVFTTEDNYETRKRGREEHELVQYPKRINFGKSSLTYYHSE